MKPPVSRNTRTGYYENDVEKKVLKNHYTCFPRDFLVTQGIECAECDEQAALHLNTFSPGVLTYMIKGLTFADLIIAELIFAN